MAKTGQKASEFVDALREKTRAAFLRETAELPRFQQESGGSSLSPWDVSYYAEKLRKARFDFDDAALRPYFSVPSVLQGAFKIATRLYGVRIEEFERLPGTRTSTATSSTRASDSSRPSSSTSSQGRRSAAEPG